MHQDTISRRDYSSFHLKAWCTQPELVPSSMELAVVEPPVRVQEEMSSKQTLGYKIGILVHSAPPPPPRAPRPRCRTILMRGRVAGGGVYRTCQSPTSTRALRGHQPPAGAHAIGHAHIRKLREAWSCCTPAGAHAIGHAHIRKLREAWSCCTSLDGHGFHAHHLVERSDAANDPFSLGTERAH
jgi:hypothetical protein